MSTSWLKPNLYVVQNGKLVPRPTTPQQKKNYRYIPFDGFNNPAPQDYFRETISRLQKENTNLKHQIAQKILEEESRNRLMNPATQNQEIQKSQLQIAFLKQQLARKEQELQERTRQLTNKDKQILELGNQNTKLHLRINNVMRELELLNVTMSKKDEQILNKKQQIEDYCRVLDKLTAKEKQQQKTMASDNYLTTPRIEQKCQQQDEFYSIQYNSLNDAQSFDRRYMTPQIQSYKMENSQCLFRSQSRIDSSEKAFDSVNSSRVNQEQKKSNIDSELSQHLKNWASWASKKKGSSISIDLLNEEVDPAAGGLASLLSRK